MRIASRSAVLVVLSVANLMVPALPGRAQTAMEFSCDVTVSAYPPTGSVSCNGTGSHAGAGGVGCVRTCALRADIHTISEACVSDGFPPLATYQMTVNMSGQPPATYRVERVGFHLTYYPDGSSVPTGEGWWQPHPPITTCAAPGPLTVTFTGELVI